MNFRDWYRALDREARKAFADRADTSPEYIEIHLLPRRKTPRRDTMQALADASDGALSFEDMVNYFLLDTAA